MRFPARRADPEILAAKAEAAALLAQASAAGSAAAAAPAVASAAAGRAPAAAAGASAGAADAATSAQLVAIDARVRAREQALLPVYQQVSPHAFLLRAREAGHPTSAVVALWPRRGVQAVANPPTHTPSLCCVCCCASSEAERETVRRRGGVPGGCAQVARSFADMHDTPVRMLAKGVLRGIVPWQASRSFLALRLRRRLLEAQLAAYVATTDPSLSRCVRGS